MKSKWGLSAVSLPVQQDLSSSGLWGLTSAKLSYLFPHDSHTVMCDRPLELLPATCTLSSLLGLHLASPPFSFFFIFLF